MTKTSTYTNPANNEINSLWKQYLNGDENSFIDIFKGLYSLLFNYGLKILRDRESVEDGIQEIFLDLWNKNDKDGINSIKAYLFASLKYNLLKKIRNEKGHLTLNTEEAAYGFDLGRDMLIEESETKSLREKQIGTALQHLSPRQQEIIYLKFNLDLSYEEICDIMQINYQASRNLISKAIKLLREVMIPFSVIISLIMINFLN